MFLIYCILALLPSIGLYRYLNRDAGKDTSLVLPLIVFVVQLGLIIAGGWLALSIAVLVFLFGAFLLYGAWYMPALEKMVEIPSGETIVFAYRDRAFRLTQRRVRVTDCDNTRINGFCFMRGAARSFKRSRVVGDVIVQSTGEIINPTAPAHPDLHKQ